MKQWIEKIHQHALSGLPIVLIGNKSDLIDRRQVSYKQAIGLARQLNIPYIETSALNGSNIEQAFEILVKRIINMRR